MDNLTNNLVNYIYDYSIGGKDVWKSKFSNVINEITYFNTENIVSDYFNHNYFRYKDIDIDIINCLFYLGDNKFKQYLINNILHILKSNNHQFYNEIHSHFTGLDL